MQRSRRNLRMQPWRERSLKTLKKKKRKATPAEL
jgi:hypothetical protein